MAYTPDPDRRRIPADVVTFVLTMGALVALFVFAPVIAREIVGAIGPGCP